VDELRRCRATSSRTGLPCNNAAILGGTVCRVHGGSAPQVRAAARRTLAEQHARAATIAELGVVPVGDPVEAFAELVAEVWAMKGHFANKVAELEKSDDLRYESSYRTEQIRTELAVYERLIKRAGELLGLWISLGIDARRVELSAAQGDLINTFMLAVLDDVFSGLAAAGVHVAVLDTFRRERLPSIVRRQVTAVGQTGAPAAPLRVDVIESAPTVAADPPSPVPPPDDDSDEDDDMAWSRFDDETEA
jgi:hypothetical protein